MLPNVRWNITFKTEIFSASKEETLAFEADIHPAAQWKIISCLYEMENS